MVSAVLRFALSGGEHHNNGKQKMWCDDYKNDKTTKRIQVQKR